MQQPLSRAITDYQEGHLSLEELRQHIEDETKTADGLRALRSLLETPDPSLPRSVRDLLTSFSTSSGAATSLHSSAIGVDSVLRGRYRLVREIGRGGMGVVYLADGLVDLQHFAVKVMNAEFLQHPDAVRVFREEARKCLAMRHPNIVGVYPLECEGGQYYLPMEYLEGKTIRELLDQDFARGVPLEQAWPIVKGAGAALAFAHDHGVIHSDLKPSNIFVTTGGRPRVLDFGIARALRDRRHFATESLGGITAAYASCEMLARGPPDFRDDVYAFACVVYEMLTGNHPFGGRTAIEARSRRMVVTPVRGLTQTQNAVLRRGLAFNCEDRVASIEEFLTVCGSDSPRGGDPRTVPRELSLPADTGFRFCHVCGKELPAVARFCPGCGVSAEAEVTTSTEHEPQMRGEYRASATDQDSALRLPRRAIAFWMTSIAAGIAVGLLSLWILRSSRSPPAPVTVSPALAPAGVIQAEGSSSGGASGDGPTVAAIKPDENPAGKSEDAAASAASAQAPIVEAVATSTPVAGASHGPETGLSASPSGHAADQSVHPARSEDIDHPPIGRKVAAFRLAEDSPAVEDACPYPAAAQATGDTGTVVLLVYIAADGNPTRTEVESSSNSKLLDDAAVDCVAQNLHFVPKRTAGTPIGSWARLRFKWSVGE